jgi:hypothetical protein
MCASNNGTGATNSDLKGFQIRKDTIFITLLLQPICKIPVHVHTISPGCDFHTLRIRSE